MDFGKIVKYPTEPTPMMRKYEDRYMDKSNQDLEFRRCLKNKCYVYDWEDGFIQFVPNPECLFIRTLFFEKNSEEKFRDIFKLAKAIGAKEVQFITRRNPKAWIRLLKKHYPEHNPELWGYHLNVTTEF